MATKFTIAQGTQGMYGTPTQATPMIVAAPAKYYSAPYTPPVPAYRQPLSMVLDTRSEPVDVRSLSGPQLLAMVGLSCAQWLAMERRDRFSRLTGWVPQVVRPNEPGASDRYYAYERLVTQACVAPGGQAKLPALALGNAVQSLGTVAQRPPTRPLGLQVALAPVGTVYPPHVIIEPDLFFLASGIPCSAWASMTEDQRTRAVIAHYQPGGTPAGASAQTLAAFRLLASKYGDYCQNPTMRPGRALAAMGVTCAQWRVLSESDRFARFVAYASPFRTPSARGVMDQLAAYVASVSAYCGSGVRPGGDVPATVVVTDPARFWKGATVVAGGLAAVLAWKLSRANARIRKGRASAAKAVARA